MPILIGMRRFPKTSSNFEHSPQEKKQFFAMYYQKEKKTLSEKTGQFTKQ